METELCNCAGVWLHTRTQRSNWIASWFVCGFVVRTCEGARVSAHLRVRLRVCSTLRSLIREGTRVRAHVLRSMYADTHGRESI